MTDDFPATDPAATPERAPTQPTMKSRWMTGRSMLALAVSVVALGFAAAPYVVPGLFGSQVRAYLLSNPGVLDEAVAARQATEDGARVAAINANVAAHPELLRADPRDPSFGPADAKVTVIEFFDFRCPGCKAVAGDYLRLMRAHPDVRFVFKDWPILDRGGEPVSQMAARAALAAHQQGKYLQVYEGLMAERALDQAAIERVLAANGVSLPAAEAVINAPDTSRHLADIHTTAAAFQLTGTPTFLINGKTTADIAPETVLRAIEAAKAGG